MAYEEWFDTSEEEQPIKPTPPKEEQKGSPPPLYVLPKEEEEPAAEEKKSDLVEVLSDMVLGLEEIPHGWDKEKVKQVLAEHLAFEKEEKARKEQEKKLSEMDAAKREQVKILSSRQPKRLGEFETPSEEYLENKKNWEKYQKMHQEFENAEQRRKKTNIPQGVPQMSKEDLEKMSLRQRSSYFSKLGLVKEPYRPPAVK